MMATLTITRRTIDSAERVGELHGSGSVRTARSAAEVVLFTFNPGPDFPGVHRLTRLEVFGYAQEGCLWMVMPLGVSRRTSWPLRK